MKFSVMQIIACPFYLFSLPL